MATLDANAPVQLQMNPIFTGDPVAAPPADVAAPEVADDDPPVVAAPDVAAADVAAPVVAAAEVGADDPPELSLPHPADTATTPTATNATTQPRRVIYGPPHSGRSHTHPASLPIITMIKEAVHADPDDGAAGRG